MCAVRAAVKVAARLDTVADNLAAAMIALGGQGMNRTLEAIKIMRDAGHHDFQRLVVIIPANFTLSHLSHNRSSSLALFAPETFSSGADHLILFGFLDAFFDELLLNRLFVGHSDGGRRLTGRAGNWIPAAILGHFFGL